jgi:hypothetical protein
MTFDDHRAPHLMHPPVWFSPLERRPPPDVLVLVIRRGVPAVDRILVVEREQLDEASGRWVRVREHLWCGTPYDRVCTGPLPLDWYDAWASAAWAE